MIQLNTLAERQQKVLVLVRRIEGSSRCPHPAKNSPLHCPPFKNYRRRADGSFSQMNSAGFTESVYFRTVSSAKSSRDGSSHPARAFAMETAHRGMHPFGSSAPGIARNASESNGTSRLSNRSFFTLRIPLFHHRSLLVVPKAPTTRSSCCSVLPCTTLKNLSCLSHQI